MGMSAVRSPYAAKLGGRIRQFRMERALSSGELAAAASVTSSAVSKVEHGKMVPSRDVLARIVTALQLPAEEQESLFDLLSQAAADAASNRGYGKGLTLLNQIADRERVCSAVSTFSNSIIPRLLQTAEYARDANRLTPWLSEREVGKAALTHTERQSVLFEDGREFTFLITESVLRTWPGELTVMAAQFDRLRQMAVHPGVRLGILPWTSAMRGLPMVSFTLYDDREVAVEMFTGELLMGQPDKVTTHVAQFRRFEESAVYGEEAIALINRVEMDLARLPQLSADDESSSK
ncbi:Scr1 family TA system antitoxin-like transcriptional regulator [Catenulispora yoronensis]|uniref:Scr1 family TA system antitoxin-like transcriptional regulator n=2 Tax=Catenulispora yoronensis TaxID=450799 RepID=A0ABP5FJ68_9ACTN